MTLIPKMIAAVLLLAPAAGSPAHHGLTPSNATSDTCVALAIGVEIPDSGQEFSRWRRQGPQLRLTSVWSRLNRGSTRPSNWLEVRPAPILGADTMWITTYPPSHGFADSVVDTVYIGAFALAWEARSDSIFFLGSRGFWTYTHIYGTWKGDTLVGRIHVSWDAGRGRDEPRANIYGMQYSCMNFTAAREAAVTAERLASHDSPDMARDLAERKAQEEEIRAWLRREGIEH